MYLNDFEKLLLVLSKREEKEIAVAGAGKTGIMLEKQLKDNGISIKVFMDNNEKLYGTLVNGVRVERIQNLGDNCLYIIAIGEENVRNALEKQLLENCIKKERIIGFSFTDYFMYYEYYRKAYLKGRCKDELSEAYRRIFGRELNWENPTRYTEILNVEKLGSQDPFKTKLSDKVEVRKWVKEKIGEKYLTKRYYEWDSVGEINFEVLPKQFVLKLNNGSGRNIIVKDRDKLDIKQTRQVLAGWFAQNYYFCNGCYELQYKDITPKIVCEEYLEGVAETVYDYNIYCFHGKPEYIWCIKGSHRPECQASFYDKEWKMMPFSFGYPKDPVIAPKPEKLEEMLELSAVLCQGFRHVRVDWYNLPDGRVLFGEITFTTWSGLRRFVPDKYDDYFGKLILEGDGCRNGF